jgi:lipopolysaccharide export LptBFGC system permease protein LptF
MKAKIMLGFLFVVLGTAFGVAAFDGGPDPICVPGRPCSATK